jgi:shikimate kinase
MMGSGKTTIGQRLASRLSVPFYDTDFLIEKKVGLTIAEMFRIHGEAFFRQQEAMLIHQWSIDEGVVATGGGLPCHSGLMEILIKKGVVIYLECSPSVLEERLMDSKTRPLLLDLNESELNHFLACQLKSRATFYLSAPYRVDAAQNTDQIIDQLLHLVNNRWNIT